MVSVVAVIIFHRRESGKTSLQHLHFVVELPFLDVDERGCVDDRHLERIVFQDHLVVWKFACYRHREVLRDARRLNYDALESNTTLVPELNLVQLQRTNLGVIHRRS